MNFLFHTRMVMDHYGVTEESVRWVQLGDAAMDWNVFVRQANQDIWRWQHELNVREQIHRTTPRDEHYTDAYYRRIQDALLPKVSDTLTIVGEGWIMVWTRSQFEDDCRWRFDRLPTRPPRVLTSIFDTPEGQS